MKQTVEIPVEEYNAMKEEIALLRNQPFLEKVNRLIELLYEEKYGLYMGNETNDLTELAIEQNYTAQKSKWDNV
jgi:hypothetical protein